MKVINLVKPYLLKNKANLFSFIIFSILLSLIGIFSPYITGSFIDNIIMSPSSNVIYTFTFLFLSIGISQLLITYIVSIIGIKLRMKISFDFNKGIIKHLHEISLIQLERQNLAYLTQKITSDTSSLTNFTVSSLNGLLINTFSFILCFSIIVKVHFLLGLVIIILIISYIVLYKFIRTPISKALHKNKEDQANYISSIQEQLTKSILIRVMNKFEFFLKKLDKSSNNLLKSSILSQKIGYLFTSSDVIITMISQISLFLIGGFEIINGRLSIGMFTMLITYFSTLVSSTKFFIALGNNYLDNLVSANRIIDILELKSKKEGNINFKHISTIEIQNLTFGYDSFPIIENFNYHFDTGKIYKINGLNGTGKSTLVNILIGLIDDYDGNIEFDNINIKQINISLFREYCLSYIGQKDLVFNGTIYENLLFDQNYSKNKIIKLLKMFNFKDIHDINYLNNVLNENGNNFSGGEIKKLAIVRALLKNEASLYILDEPTNYLDIDSKKTLNNLLLNNKKNKIILLITHETCFDDIIDYEINFKSSSAQWI